MIDIDDIYNAIHEYPLLVFWMERRRMSFIEHARAFATRLLQELSGTDDPLMIGYDRRYFLEPASGPTKRVAQWKQEQRRYRK